MKLDIRRSGRRFHAEALLNLSADAQTVWDTITDYDNLPGFMPGIHSCRVIERRALSPSTEQVMVEQHGEFRALLFAQAMTVRLRIEHQLFRVAEAKVLSVDLGRVKSRLIEVFEGRYELTPQSVPPALPRTLLRYQAVIGLRLPPPPVVGTLAIRQNLSAQLEAIAQEVIRRSGRSDSNSAKCKPATVA